MKHPDYVSPRTLRRRKGRAIRKVRRESRQRFAVFAEGIGIATGAFAAVAAGIASVGAASLIATTRIRALEAAATKFAADVVCRQREDLVRADGHEDTFAYCGDCGAWPRHAPWCLRLQDHPNGGM